MEHILQLESSERVYKLRRDSVVVSEQGIEFEMKLDIEDLLDFLEYDESIHGEALIVRDDEVEVPYLVKGRVIANEFGEYGIIEFISVQFLFFCSREDFFEDHPASEHRIGSRAAIAIR